MDRMLPSPPPARHAAPPSPRSSMRSERLCRWVTGWSYAASASSLSAKREARLGGKPRTGDQIQVLSKSVPRFNCGKICIAAELRRVMPGQGGHGQ
jgi:hypothetical protein